MSFSSLSFIFIFLPVSLIIYYAVPKKLKNIVLTIESLLFYAWGDMISFAVLVASSAFDFLIAYCIYRYDDKPKTKKLSLAVSLIMNIVMLILLKGQGADFDFDSNSLISLAIPLGISFYTLTKISYVIDVYKTKIKFDGSFINFLFYVSFFPRLSSVSFQGYDEFKEDIKNASPSLQNIGCGSAFFVKGLAKCVLLGDNIGHIWLDVKGISYENMTTLTAWLGIISFSLMVYFSFSGYCDMAYGISKMFGFGLKKNFNHPYMAKSVTDFWQRWHITLTKWFNTYVYKISGSNNRGLKTYGFTLLIFALIGLWHGFTLNFLCWGIYFGILLIFEKCFFLEKLKKLPSWAGIVYTLLAVIISWTIFAGKSISDSLNYLSVMFKLSGSFANQYSAYILTSYITLLLICIFASTDFFRSFVIGIRENKIASNILSIAVPILAVVLFMICISFMVGAPPEKMLYFRY